MRYEILTGDSREVLKTLPSESVDCIVTSPPYYQLRDYGVDRQIGLEDSVAEYIANLMIVFTECHRILKKTGTLWIVIADTYNGDKKGITDRLQAEISESRINKTRGRLPRKTLLAIPARLQIAMIDPGWVNRNRNIWWKRNCMTNSAKDKFTPDYEDIQFFTRSERYKFNQLKEPMVTKSKYQAAKGVLLARERDRNDDIRPRGSIGTLGKQNSGRREQDEVGRKDYEGFNARYTYPADGMRNMRCVWDIPTESSPLKHYAMFPRELARRMVLAGSMAGGVVLDPFCGAGTTGIVAKQEGRDFIGIELNPEYAAMAERRIKKTVQQLKLI